MKTPSFARGCGARCHVFVSFNRSHRSRVRGSFIDDYKFDRDLERDRPRRMRHYHDYGYDYSLDYDTLGLTDDIHGRDPSPRRPIHGPTDFETYESEFLPPRAPHRTTEPRKYTSYLYDDELGYPVLVSWKWKGKGRGRKDVKHHVWYVGKSLKPVRPLQCVISLRSTLVLRRATTCIGTWFMVPSHGLRAVPAPVLATG